MEDYASQRAALFARERAMSSFPILSAEELKADEVLHALKAQFESQFSVIEMIQFYRVAERLKETQLFKVLYKMPKGAHLHVHSTGSVDPSFLRHEILNNPKVNYSPSLSKFSVKHGDAEGYQSAAEYFNGHPERMQELNNLLSLNEVTGTGSSKEVWKYFLNLFIAQGNITNSLDVFERFIVESFVSMHEENVQRVEYKHLPKLLFTDSESLSLEDEAKLLQRIVAQFQSQHPDFSVGFVVVGFKSTPAKDLKTELLEVVQVAGQYPKVYIGYDLVGEEETLNQMIEYGEVLAEIKHISTAAGHPLQYFFHAGETVNPRNENLYDVLALDTLRIGHGINLGNHPALLEEVKRRGILVECCPLSNMLLRYVTDPRTHPVQGFLRRGVRVSINSDDPGMFGYRGVTLDFLYVTVLWNLGLAELKKVVIDSIECCTEPEETMKMWAPKWEEFVHYLSQLNVAKQ